MTFWDGWVLLAHMKTLSQIEARIDDLKRSRAEAHEELQEYIEGSPSAEEMKEEIEIINGQIDTLKWVLAEK